MRMPAGCNLVHLNRHCLWPRDFNTPSSLMLVVEETEILWHVSWS